MKHRGRRILLFFAAAFFTWSLATGISIWKFGNEDHAKHSDCIIVLGAATHGSKPSPVFEERIRHAITLFKDGKATTIIFTGGYGDGSTHSEGEVGAAYALNKGVGQASILTESRSKTTRQNLIEARALMDATGLKTAIIVSDPLHLKRASTMAADLGISTVTSPTPTSRYRSFLTKSKFLSREIFFLTYYSVTGN